MNVNLDLLSLMVKNMRFVKNVIGGIEMSEDELRNTNPYGHLTMEKMQQKLHDDISSLQKWLEKENKMPVRVNDLKPIHDTMLELEARLDILRDLASQLAFCSHDLWLEYEKNRGDESK